MNDLEDRITASLRANAERSGPFEGLERQAVPRATRIRRHRRIAGVAMAVALVAVVSLGVRAVPELPLDDIEPAGPTTRVADKTVQIPDDPGTLSLGEAPKIPWYDGEYIHDGSKRVRVGKDNRLQFGRIDGGYWIQRGGAQGPITLIDAEGQTIGGMAGSPTTAPVVSADGKRLAWTEDDGTAVVADATGRELKRKRIRKGIEPAGFFGEKVLLGGWSASVLWDPSSGSTKSLRLDTPMDTMATDGRDLVPVRTRKGCVGVYSFARQKALWERCGSGSVNGLSADGRHTMLEGLFELNGKGMSSGVVTDAKTGRPLLRIERVGLPMMWASEPGGAVLIESGWIGRKAIVRCIVESGRCELATEPVAVSSSDDDATGSPPILAANN